MYVYFRHNGLSLCCLRLLLFKPILVFRLNKVAPMAHVGIRPRDLPEVFSDLLQSQIHA